MLTMVKWENLTTDEQNKILQRPALATTASPQQVKDIIAQVRAQGDQALLELTQRYDRVNLKEMAVREEELQQAENDLSAEIKTAIQQAAHNIEKFHQAQYPQNLKIKTAPGITCEMQYRPLQRVGLYVPGGSAVLVSTVLMLAIPAKIAGCPLRILCSPPMADGSINPYVLYAAKLCGVEKIFKVGGAQAIAAMAFGTATIPKVDKVFGPGNSWVTLAKILVAQDPAGANYDLPAGPSEQLVIADKEAEAAFVAADLLSQAEHSIDAQVILISDDKNLLEKVNQEINQQLLNLPRCDIAKQALQHSKAILVDNIDMAITIANAYAPEHLLLQIKNPRDYINKIKHAGSVFLGKWSTESVGDYASGANHALPTYGYAHNHSGLGLVDFMQRITFQELTQQGLQHIANTVELLAEIEGLHAHQYAVTVRREWIAKTKSTEKI